jgi:peptidoglycan hydrolase-like protein with peptidoglycan-binding domain
MKMILMMLSASLILSASMAAQTPAPTPAKTITISERNAPKTAMPAAPKKSPFRPTKDQIKEAQGKLKAKGTYSGEENGTYNDPFRGAIKSFQQENGLEVNGKLDRTTLEKMGIALTDKQTGTVTEPAGEKSVKPDSSDKPKRGPVFKATKDQVNEAQRKLKAANMYAGEEIGKLDDATREGLKKYQEANGLKITGTLNQITLEKMGIALTDKQKANAAAAEANK